MRDNLKFDIEQFQIMSSKLRNLAEDLEVLEKDLSGEMDVLREGWETPAGRKFFEQQNTEWSAQVKSYIRTIETLKDMIDYAIEEYSIVEQAVNAVYVE